MRSLLLLKSGSITPRFEGLFGVHWIIKRRISLYIVIHQMCQHMAKKNAIEIDGIFNVCLHTLNKQNLTYNILLVIIESYEIHPFR